MIPILVLNTSTKLIMDNTIIAFHSYENSFCTKKYWHVSEGDLKRNKRCWFPIRMTHPSHSMPNTAHGFWS